MMSRLNTEAPSPYSVIPALYIVAPTTCGICRAAVKSMQHYVPVVYTKSFPGPLLRGFRVELCTVCHELFQSDPEELKRRRLDLFEFIHERITSGKEIPMQIGGELPRRQR